MHKTDDELEYIIADCNDAIASYPENPHVRKYFDERDRAGLELYTRREKRRVRRNLRLCGDPLAWRLGFPRRYVRELNLVHYQALRQAQFDYGWRKRCGRQ